jgi:hypothetical protein
MKAASSSRRETGGNRRMKMPISSISIVDGSVNLLAVMYGTIYFPTYSNSLKEIARWLGFDFC